VAAGLAMLAAVGAATPVRAAVVEVSTSVAVEDADDRAALETAVRSAVDEALKEATAFTPTLVVLTRAVVTGGRLYIRLLLAGELGEQPGRESTAPGDESPAAAPALPRTDI
jgi:hypothetical protein